MTSLIAYIFDPGPSRNIILFVIVTWGLLLHFSRYVFNKERSNASPKGELSIGDEHIKIGEIELSYDKIDFLNIYIDGYENQNRGFYGGAIGVFGFDGSVNHAITIRSFLSKNNTLFFQAGAGVVVDSNEENELQEVNNKLGALKQALKLAEEI